MNSVKRGWNVPLQEGVVVLVSHGPVQQRPAPNAYVLVKLDLSLTVLDTPDTSSFGGTPLVVGASA